MNEELGSILINPEMAETQVLVRNAGVVECDLGSSQTLDFTAYVEFDNKWETTTEYVYGDEVLDAYNAEHGTNYLPTPSPSRRRSSKWASARPCRISRSTSRS